MQPNETSVRCALDFKAFVVQAQTGAVEQPAHEAGHSRHPVKNSAHLSSAQDYRPPLGSFGALDFAHRLQLYAQPSTRAYRNTREHRAWFCVDALTRALTARCERKPALGAP